MLVKVRWSKMIFLQQISFIVRWTLQIIWLRSGTWFPIHFAPYCHHEHNSSVGNGSLTERTTIELDIALKSVDPRRFSCSIYYVLHENHLGLSDVKIRKQIYLNPIGNLAITNMGPIWFQKMRRHNGNGPSSPTILKALISSISILARSPFFW